MLCLCLVWRGFVVVLQSGPLPLWAAANGGRVGGGQMVMAAMVVYLNIWGKMGLRRLVVYERL